MFSSVTVIGAGRVGSAVAARLRERGVAVRTTGRELDVGDPELVLLCVPDDAIAAVAAQLPNAPGRWFAHTSGALGTSALVHKLPSFVVHPLQTFTRRDGGAAQLDGAWAAVSAGARAYRESPELRAGFAFAEQLGLRPFALGEGAKPLYHAGAVMASNYLVTLHWAASELFRRAGAPPEALEPLMRRTIENGFELTGPIERGDWETVEAHRAAIREVRPDLEPLYDVLAEATR